MKTNMLNFISRYRNIFLSAALMLLLASCMDDDNDFVNEPVEVAYVSIYHAAPNAPDFDILVDGRVINRNPFDYTSYSGYLNFFTGDREIRFNAVNADNSLIDTTFNFEEGKAYSLFAINHASSVEALLVTDTARAPASGNAMIRFVNLSPDAPAFDVAIEGNQEPLFEESAFTDSTPFAEIEADTYTFNIRNAGATDTVLAAEDVDILPGRYYTIVTRGFASPPDGNNYGLSLEILD